MAGSPGGKSGTRQARSVQASRPSSDVPDALPFSPAEIAHCLLAWYGREGRDLPWRGTRDPYRIWLSEVMLQQTGVATVIPFYRRFLERYPTVAALAAAPVEEVVEAWAGLGYYSRARRLHAAAVVVAAEYGGAFPEDLEGLQSLPGVGRSTAGAILSIAFDRPAPILDGNVRRVLCRLFALEGDPRRPAAEQRLWAWAEALTPADRPHDYAQAIMDLGATVCTPRRPACATCPVAGLCRARTLGREDELPQAVHRKAVPKVTEAALLLADGERLLVRRRPLAGMLGGLWEFPTRRIPDGGSAAGAAAGLLAELGLAADLREAGRVRHAYSHFKLDLHLLQGRVRERSRVAEEGWQWLDGAQVRRLALHGAHLKALKQLPGLI